MIPYPLHIFSLFSIVLGIVCALWVAADVIRRPPYMTVMAFVWPLTALFGSLLLTAFYLRHGRARPLPEREGKAHTDNGHGNDTPFPVAVAKGALHCGAGCSLGDIIAEILAFAFPATLLFFGYPGLFSDRVFAAWGLDFVLAFALGILFQYYAIVPMRNLKPLRGLWAAVKADALSLISWQIGMYGFMAIAHFWLFGHVLQAQLEPNSAEFWFMMQLAMVAGFVTAYPTNWWLIRARIKERM
ncbi:MAG: DUF4396 domain-containing protein [Thiogranum sp.]